MSTAHLWEFHLQNNCKDSSFLNDLYFHPMYVIWSLIWPDDKKLACVITNFAIFKREIFKNFVVNFIDKERSRMISSCIFAISCQVKNLNHSEMVTLIIVYILIICYRNENKIITSLIIIDWKHQWIENFNIMHYTLLLLCSHLILLCLSIPNWMQFKNKQLN